MDYQNIFVETRGDGPRKVGLITLYRPNALNALSDALMDELGHALLDFDGNPAIGCIVLTGGDKVFAAGADVAELSSHDFSSALRHDLISRNWETIRKVRIPVIAAVAGYALGGGCELAMMCDTIVAADNAKFGQPEIRLGIIPGAGGTQRLPRAIGKAKAMDMLLTSRTMDAHEAERSGLVSRVVAPERLLGEAVKMAEEIAAMSAPAVRLIKEAVNRAFESSLSDGVMYERRIFHALFGTHDQREGMAAFVAKRSAAFAHQ